MARRNKGKSRYLYSSLHSSSIVEGSIQYCSCKEVGVPVIWTIDGTICFFLKNTIFCRRFIKQQVCRRRVTILCVLLPSQLRIGSFLCFLYCTTAESNRVRAINLC